MTLTLFKFPFLSLTQLLSGFEARLDIYFAGDETQWIPVVLEEGNITVAEQTHTYQYYTDPRLIIQSFHI